MSEPLNQNEAAEGRSDSTEVLERAYQYADTATDERGRITYEFDNHGVLAFVASFNKPPAIFFDGLGTAKQENSNGKHLGNTGLEADRMARQRMGIRGILARSELSGCGVEFHSSETRWARVCHASLALSA